MYTYYIILHKHTHINSHGTTINGENLYEFNQDLFLLFIDCKQIYDSITIPKVCNAKIWNTEEIGEIIWICVTDKVQSQVQP